MPDSVLGTAWLSAACTVTDAPYLPLLQIKCLMQQLLSGVAYLHDNWVIHRDLVSLSDTWMQPLHATIHSSCG